MHLYMRACLSIHQVRHHLLTVIISEIYFWIYFIYLWGVPSKNLRVIGAWGLVPATPKLWWFKMKKIIGKDDPSTPHKYITYIRKYIFDIITVSK